MTETFDADGRSVRSAFARLPSERQRRILGAVGGSVLVAGGGLVLAFQDRGLYWLAVTLAGLLIFAQPHLPVLLIYLLLGLRLDPVTMGPLGTADLLAAPLVFLLTLQMLRERGMSFLRVPHMRLLVAIGGVLLAATGWSILMHPEAPVEALDQSWGTHFAFFRNLLLLIVFVYFVRTRRHLAEAVVMFIVMIVLLAVDGLGFFGAESRNMRAQAAYFGGFAGNNNRLAFLCVLGTGLVWAARFKSPKGWWRQLALVPLGVLPFTTLMTGSRSGLLQLLVLGGLILFEQRQWAPAQRVRAVVVMAAVAFVLVALTPAALVDRASNLDVGGPSTIDRIYALRHGAQMIIENPIFGVGPGNFVWRMQLLSGHAMSQHNSYLWAITSGGPLMLILYLALFYRTYRTLRVIEGSGSGPFVWLATGLRFNLVTFLIFSAFATIWLAHVFWILIGLTVVLDRVTPRTRCRSADMTDPRAVLAR